MRKLKSALLYTALALVANTAVAESGYETPYLPKLVWHQEAMPASDAPFSTPEGDQKSLTDFRGKVILVNFWATWCVPCRMEMPALAALQDAMGGDDFEVVTIATGRNPQPAIDRFFEEIDVDNLPRYSDARMQLSRSMMVMGLPVSVLIDRDGNEIARLTGDENWGSDAAKELIAKLIAD